MNRVEKEAVLHCLRSMIDEEVCEECPLYGTTGTDHCEKDCVRLAINELEQEPKTGHWIHRKMDNECWEECSECHVERAYPTLYCPDCGAKMVEPQESEEQHG